MICNALKLKLDVMLTFLYILLHLFIISPLVTMCPPVQFTVIMSFVAPFGRKRVNAMNIYFAICIVLNCFPLAVLVRLLSGVLCLY